MPKSPRELVADGRVIPVIVLDRVQDAVPLAGPFLDVASCPIRGITRLAREAAAPPR
ncbi:MAG TPA: hypothetical protein PLA97_10610 [Rubrivivax sp.]|nr:hypothetical protein [Rubrivivax sp.]